METAAKPMIACINLDILPVGGDEMEQIDDLMRDTGVRCLKINSGLACSRYT